MNRDLYSYSNNYINRWVVSYADFITMLLALFMVMYALSQIDAGNLKEFSHSVDKVLKLSNKSQNTGISLEKDELEQKSRLIKIFSSTKTGISITNVNISDQKNQMNNLKTQIKNLDNNTNRDAVEFKNIENLLKKGLENTDEISMTRESRGLVIRLKDTILFDAGSDIIKDKARLTLDKIAEILKKTPNSIRIEGHTDNQPIKTSKFPSNWELSTARATNIIRYLINNHKFNPDKLSAVGYGEYMPLENISTKENDALNRRVDIVILSSASKIFEPDNSLENKEQLER